MDWFLAVARTRGGSGFGPNPLSYHDLAAWAALSGCRPAPWEVEAIMAMDQAWLKAVHERHGKEKPKT